MAKDKNRNEVASETMEKQIQSQEKISFLEKSMRLYAKEKFKKKRKYGIVANLKAPFKPAIFMTGIITAVAAVVLLFVLIVGNKYSTEFHLKASDLVTIYINLVVTSVLCVFMAAYIYIALVAQVISMFLSHRNGVTYQVIGLICSGFMAYQIGQLVSEKPGEMAWHIVIPAFLFLIWCVYAYKVFNELYELPSNNGLSVESWTKDI